MEPADDLFIVMVDQHGQFFIRCGACSWYLTEPDPTRVGERCTTHLQIFHSPVDALDPQR